MKEVEPGQYSVRLFGVSRNCSLSGQNPRTVTVVTRDTTEVTFEATCASPPPLTPLQDQIVFLTDRDDGISDIFVMNADGTNPVNLTNTPFTQKEFVRPSPDKGRIALLEMQSAERYRPRYSPAYYRLHVVDADGIGEIEVLRSIGPGPPSWSPDGGRIAVATYQEFTYRRIVRIVSLDGTGAASGFVDLPCAVDVCKSPAWSPDGSEIAFVGVVDGSPGDSDVYVMQADGMNPVRLTTIGVAGPPEWSPDGSRLAYATGSQLTVMNADGSNPIALKSDQFVLYADPDWSPDGESLVFSCAVEKDPANWDICAMRVDGTSSAILASDPAHDWSPRWAK